MPIITDNKIINRESGKPHKITIYRLLFILLIFLILYVLVDMNIRPVIKTMTEYHGKVLASRIINDSIYQVLNEQNTNYKNLVNILRNQNESIVGIESNIIGINKIQSLITNKIIENIYELDKDTIRIPIGSFTGLQYFYGRGPLIEFGIVPNGNVKTKIISDFKSAGINQTHHKIILNIEVNISILIPFYATRVSVPSDFTLAETIIVGDVPEYFTEVISSDEKNISDINDYGNPNKTN